MVKANGQDVQNVPPWLANLGVKSGEWFIDTKGRAERAMKDRFISPPGRFYACLTLASMGYQSQLAVTMKNGKRVPLTPKEVCDRTDVDLRHFSRHMRELELYGLAERRGGTKNKVEIYVWAVPRAINEEGIAAKLARTEIRCEDGEIVPADVQRALKRFGRGEIVAERGDIPELQRMVAVRKEIDLSLRAYADSHRVSGPYIRKKVTERNIERNELTGQSEETIIAGSGEPGVRPSVDSSSASIRERIRSLLTVGYGDVILTVLDKETLDAVAAVITDDALLGRFEGQLEKQKTLRPGSWKVFVPIAESCARGYREWAAQRKTAEAQSAAKMPRDRDQLGASEADSQLEAQVEAELKRIGEAEYLRRAKEAVKRAGFGRSMSETQRIAVGRGLVRNEIREALRKSNQSALVA